MIMHPADAGVDSVFEQQLLGPTLWQQVGMWSATL